VYQTELADNAPVGPEEIRVLGMGVHVLDMRRVDVAVDLAPCIQPVTVEMVIVGPEGDELSSVLLVDNRQWRLDKVMHLRQDAQPGEHVLHVGVFHEDELVARAAGRFVFPLNGTARAHG